MSSHRILSLVAAFLLAVGAFAPLTVRSESARQEVSFVAVSTDGLASDVVAEVASTDRKTDEADQPKRKEGGFARAILAPFRALARLFGGGKKSAKQEARKKDVKTPGAVAAPAVVVAETSEPQEKKDKQEQQPVDVGAEVGRAAAPPTDYVPQPAAMPAESTPIVRPAEARPAPQPEMWVPVIEGISKDPLSQGRALLQHGYLSEAVSELTIAAAFADNLVEANNLLGLAYDRMGRHRAAIEAYERALSVAPNDAVVLANLGNSYYLEANYVEALKRLKKAARLSPATPVIHNNLGIVQARIGRYDDAFKSFARAGGDYDAHVKLADILETAKREKDAAKHYEAALRLQPGTNALLERLVAIYERTGRRDKADTARRALGQPKNEQKTTTGGGGG